ncbi:methyltransferase domain-containing protein [Nanohaloarchaea archaeon]|nr:methyltransferase domain-containing protein [Candidatus Nanohaloarchaea archaeon]
MKQSNLLNKVKQIFTKQGFKLDVKSDHEIHAESDTEDLNLKIFSSEKFSADEVQNLSESGDLVFVDEPLRSGVDKLEAETSVISQEKEESEDLDVPSYERIGDIVIIKQLNNQSRQEAVEAVKKHNPNLGSILLKTDNREGEFRLGSYEKLYGDKTETIHREHGVQIKVDPTKAFFSEKEGTERRRIFNSVNKGEDVLVMFCGVAPFPVTIARNAKPEKVVGVEKNPEAVEYALKNLELNNIEDQVELIQGDVSDVCPSLGKFDRVLMPSPTNSLDFLQEALSCVEEDGVLVAYSVEDRKNLYENVIEKVGSECDSKDLRAEVLRKRVVADFSPSKRKVAVEFLIKTTNSFK